MNDDRREAEFASIYPLSRNEIAGLPLADAEAELRAAILAEPAQASVPAARPAAPRQRRPLRWGLTGGLGLAVAGLAALFFFVGPAGKEQKPVPKPGFDAGLVQVAKTSPLVLLRQPGWHVGANAMVESNRGEMHFFRRHGGHGAGARETAQLSWRSGELGTRTMRRFEQKAPYTVILTPTLGTHALALRFLQIHETGAAANKRFTAIWRDHGRVITFSSNAASLDAFRKQIGSLHRVGPIAWLTALPEELTRNGGPLAP
jgi:hypothetical protein